MLGAAGRAATVLVKQASKAGNVASVLPAASVARKYKPSIKSKQSDLVLEFHRFSSFE